MQPVDSKLSGDDNIIHGLPIALFNLTMEISDVVLQSLTGSVKGSANVPPLKIEPPERIQNFHLVNKSSACVYSVDGSGKGVFVFQRICNVGNGGSFANVSLEFEGCHGVQLYDGSLPDAELSGPYQYTSVASSSIDPLGPGGCYEKVLYPMFVPIAKNIKSFDQLYSINPLDQPYCREDDEKHPKNN